VVDQGTEDGRQDYRHHTLGVHHYVGTPNSSLHASPSVVNTWENSYNISAI